MKSYIYKLKDDSGRPLFGFIEARSVSEVKEHLRGSSFYFIGAKPYDKKHIYAKKVKLDILLMFTRRLSTLIESGIPILLAMNILWRQTEDKTMQLVISYVRLNLEKGKKISEALGEFPNIFPPLYLALISVAEKAGGLVAVLKRLTQYLEQRRQNIMRTKKVTLYPSIVVSFAILVIICMFAFVVPTFQKVLFKLNVELPALTRIVIGISEAMRSWAFILSVLIIGIIFFGMYKFMRQKEKFSYYIDKLKLKIPFWGYILQSMFLGRFINSLSIMIGAGVPLVESFEVSKTTAGNQYIRDGINDVQEKVEQGVSLYEAFKEAATFPVMLIEMVGIAEASGRTVDVLETLGHHFDEEVEYRQNKFFTIIEPALIVFVGIIIVITLLAIYLPVFSIWQGLT